MQINYRHYANEKNNKFYRESYSYRACSNYLNSNILCVMKKYKIGNV